MAGRDDDRISEMLQMATRNHGMPLEALWYDRTPVGLHFLLTHFDIPMIDPADWALTIDGGIGEPLTLGLEDLTAMPAVTVPVVMECAGNGRARLEPRPVGQPWLFEAVGQAEWTGVRLADVLEAARVSRETRDVVFRGADHGIDGGIEQHYERSLPLAEALRPEVILAHQVNGTPLPPQHGFPVRLIVPAWYGMASVKWLTRITASATPFRGYQQARAYRVRTSNEPGEPVTRILPRSLMVPPGIPDFHSRARFVDEGPIDLVGRAWSGHGEVVSVQVSTDDGASWKAALLEPAVSEHGWQRWAHRWEATPGPAVLCSRATDEAGLVQPDQPVWNAGGYEVNAVQRVPVQVRARQPI
jgi:DMSO/TMAO reductase YedYZ molybdopterin-dependent catalytic subunit